MTKKRKQPVQTSDSLKRKSLRLAAKSIKSTPEPEQIVYEKLTLTLADNGHAVYIEIVKDPETSEEWEFEPTKEGCKIRNLQDHSEKQAEAVNFIKAAGEQFMEVLKTPNLHLKQLFIDLEHPESICRKLEAARKMSHPEDKEFECTPPECIKKLHEDNSKTLLKLLEKELKLFNFKLSVECFEIEFDELHDEFLSIFSALQPTILKRIVIVSKFLISIDELVNSEQWKKAEHLECFGRSMTMVEHWKHFKTVDINLSIVRKEALDEILKTFLFLTTWERISMKFPFVFFCPAEYFQGFQVPDTTIIPGIVDNWVINVSKMNHKVNVIHSDGILHLFRKQWVPNRKKEVAIRRKFRKAEAVLVELPDVLARHIVEQLDEMSKQSLRQTCRFFNHIVKTTGSTYEKLTLTLADNRSAIFIELYIDAENRLELEFEQDPLGYTVKNPQQGWEQTVVHNRHRFAREPQFAFIEAAVQHFLKIFTNKTVVKKLCIVTENPFQVFSVLPRTERPDSATMCQYAVSYSMNLVILKKKLLDRLATTGAKELCCYPEVPPSVWSRFSTTKICIDRLFVEQIQEIYQTLLDSTNWNSVLLRCGYINLDAMEFLNRLEDQRPLESRIVDSKLIRIPNVPNQFINCQLSRPRNISFTRVIQ